MITSDETVRTFLITGATGFLGRRLVVRLLADCPDAQILAMARQSDPQQDDAQRHIAERAGDAIDRVQWIACDITQPMLGLDEEQIAALAGTGELNVLHLAALYDLEADEAPSKALTLDGAVHAYELAVAIRRHAARGGRPVRFCQTSTLVVAGGYQGEFGETGEELSLAAGSHTDWYSRHKYEAEVALRRLAAENDVPIMFARPGIAVGDSDTGAIEKLDGPYMLLEYMRWPILRHVLPSGSDDTLWMVPGDFVVLAIATLGANPDAYGQTFNLLYPPGEAPIWRELVAFTLRILRSRDYAGGGLLPALRYGWHVPLPPRWLNRAAEVPLLGKLVQRIFVAMGVAPHSLYYATDNPQYVVENYRKLGVEPPPPWRDVWQTCMLYYRDHREDMKAEARVAHQVDR